MIIQNNMPAVNAHRQMLNNSGATSKSLEKLSSGFRINRAGDDAAGLAISEKMRAQIRGLDQAGRNSQDGISLIQTAEGALQETHKILQRMRELSVQSANGIYDDPVDRSNLNKEVDRLKQEVDRISTSTNFNGIKLLDGNLESVASVKNTAGVDAGEMKNVGQTVDGKDFKTQTYSIDLATVGFDFTNGVAADADTYEISFQSGDGTAVTLTSRDVGTVFGSGNGRNVKSVDDIAKLFDGQVLTQGTTGAAAYTVKAIGTKLELKMTTSATGTTAGGAPDPTTAFVDKPNQLKLDGNVTFAGTTTNAGTVGVTTGEKLNGKLKEVQRGTNSTYITNTLTKAAFEALNLRDGDTLSFTVGGMDNTGTPPTGTAPITVTFDYKSSGADPTNSAGAATGNLSFTTIEDLIKAVNQGQAAAGAPGGLVGADADAVQATAIGNNETGMVIKMSGGTLTGAGATDTIGTDGKMSITLNSVAKSADSTITFRDGVREGTTVTVGSKTFEFVADAKNATQGNAAIVVNALNGGASLTGAQAAKSFNDFLNTIDMVGYSNERGKTPGVDDNQVTITSLDKSSKAEVSKVDVSGGGLTFQIGANGFSDQRVSLNVGDMGAGGLGIRNISVATQDQANLAIGVLDSAINQNSAQRAELGALQNRLEHTISNLAVNAENLQAAESRIRDVDMAKEMMAFTKNNILNQASQAMLAQANMQPQGVLQLLR